MVKWSLDGTLISSVNASIERREEVGYKRSEVLADQMALPSIAPLAEALRAIEIVPDAVMLLEREIVRRMMYPSGKRDPGAHRAVKLRYAYVRPGETEPMWQARAKIPREAWALVANRVRDPHREGIDLIIEALERSGAEFFEGDIFDETLPQIVARREALLA
jgi:hypothetical protein